MHNIHNLGSVIRLDTSDHSGEPGGVDGRFRNAITGALVDPDVVKLTVTNPANVETTYTYSLGEVTRAGVGDFYKNQEATAAGTWYYRWWSTGNGQAADVQRFVVRDARGAIPTGS